MPAPDVADVSAYLSQTGHGEWDPVSITDALEAEKAAQAARCRVPAVELDDEDNDVSVWPADLTEALLRRVAANLALRSLPLGVSSSFDSINGVSQRIGSGDPEVRRLEAPHRRLVVG